MTLVGATLLRYGPGDQGGHRRLRLSERAPLMMSPSVVSDSSFRSSIATACGRTFATADATVIIVAQRISTITEADQILVLDNGRIVDRGTHQELLETSPTYQEIVESQLSVEEVA